MDKLAKGRDDWRKGVVTTKSREAKRNSERLHFKFIVKYVEGLHPEIYEKAEELYKETMKTNPNVMDLTKTVRFMSAATPNKPIPRYYYRRSGQQQEQKMVLRIPLLNKEQQPVPDPIPQQTVPEPMPQHPVPVQQLPAPVVVPSPQQTVPDPMPQHQVPVQQLPVPVVVPEPMPQHPLLIPPEVYNDLLLEIQKDPEMAQIFNDITDDDGSMNDHVWNDVCMTDTTTQLENFIDSELH